MTTMGQPIISNGLNRRSSHFNLVQCFLSFLLMEAPPDQWNEIQHNSADSNNNSGHYERDIVTPRTIVQPTCKVNILFLIQFYILFNIFSSYETGQSVGGRRRENPEKKNTWHTRKQNLACLTCGQCGARTHTSGETIE